MKIALGSDHAGYELKQGVIKYLAEEGIDFHDFGCSSDEKVDYVDFGEKAAQKVSSGEYARAILFCATGLGMAIVANKFKRVRATPCYEGYGAEMSRKHNDSNCLTLGGRIIPLDEAIEIVKIWLETEFEEGRHRRRINKILQIEERNFKKFEEE
jgi:ribose 5-phosphate isomerase B